MIIDGEGRGIPVLHGFVKNEDKESVSFCLNLLLKNCDVSLFKCFVDFEEKISFLETTLRLWRSPENLNGGEIQPTFDVIDPQTTLNVFEPQAALDEDLLQATSNAIDPQTTLNLFEPQVALDEGELQTGKFRYVNLTKFGLKVDLNPNKILLVKENVCCPNHSQSWDCQKKIVLSAFALDHNYVSKNNHQK